MARSERGMKCEAKKTDGSGEKCRQPAGAGTDHVGWGRCKFHGGSTSGGKMAAAKEEYRERFLGDEVAIEPTEAILEEIRRSAGHVRWLHSMILKFDEALEGSDASRVLLQLSEQGWNKAAWTKLYADERTHLVRTSKMAIDAGIAERQVKLAENQGELIAVALRGILRDLGLTPEQEAAAPAIVVKHLKAVS